MEAIAFVQHVTQGDDRLALSELRRDLSLAAARDAEGVSVICLAVYRRRSEVAAALAAARTDLDIFEATCLGDLGRVRQLVSSDPTHVNAVSPDGFSSVGYSAFFGHAAVLQELIRRGGEVNTPSRNGMRVCPLHSAAAHSDQAKAVELARIVLEAGADPNVRQQGGFTALHEAAVNCNAALIEVLLQHGADPKIKNEKGASAADLARAKGHDEVVRLLEAGTA